MADKKLDVTPQEPVEEIGGDTTAQPEEPAPFPPAGHRSERFDAIRPDGTHVTVTRDIDTGEQLVAEA